MTSSSTPTSTLPPISPLGLLLAERERRRRRKQKHLDGLRADSRALAAAAGFPTLDPWQEQALASDAPRLALVCGRQTGKSTVTSLLIVRELLRTEGDYRPMVACVSASLRQAHELYRKVLAAWRTLGKPARVARATTTGLELSTGARLEIYPASSDTIRGLSAVTLLAIDEAGWVPDELFASVLPFLSVSQGRLCALGSPAGQRGWFYSLYEQAKIDPATQCLQVSSYACPRIDRAWLDAQERTIGVWWMRQEYGDAAGGPYFMEPQTAAFREADIQAAITDDVEFAAELFAP